MNKNLILKTDILDIIFENRNKAYGAYNLRKLYPSRLKLALGIMFLLATVFSAFTMLPEKKELHKRTFTVIETELKDIAKEIPEPEKPQVKKAESVKADVKPAIVPQKRLINNIAIVDNNTKTDSIVTLLPTDQIGKVTVNVPSAPPLVVAPPASPAIPGGKVNTIPKLDLNTPMDGNAVDVLPAYPGGMDALKAFLERNLKNPYDLENGEIVNVRVKFVVGYNGKLQSFATVLDGGDMYNKEVVRVLKKMPDWEPGKSKGENVSVYYTIPVKFVMSN